MITNKTTLNFLLFILLFTFPGCSDREKARKVDLNKTEEIKDIAGDTATLRIGLIPEQDIRKMAGRYEPLAAYLSGKMNRKVILVYLDNYGEACDKFIYKQLDAAFFGSFSYTLTHAKAGVEPVSRPEYAGVSKYRGLIIVRRDSGIKNVADMKGKRLALVHRSTYAGYLYPLYYFKMKGVKDFNSYFSGVTFAGSHDKAIAAVLRKDADIAIAKDLVYQRMIRENPDLENQLAVLAASDPVPSNALCVSKELDTALKTQLKGILLGIGDDNKAGAVLKSLGGASKFVETKDEDYGPLYVVIKALGINLNTYPYFERSDMGFAKANGDIN